MYMTAVAETSGNLLAPIAAALRGHWCIAWLVVPAQDGLSLVRLKTGVTRELAAFGDQAVMLRLPLQPKSRRRWAVIYLPADAHHLRLDVFGAQEPWASAVIGLRPLSRPMAAALLASRQPGLLLKALIGSPVSLRRRARRALSTLATSFNQATPYSRWVELFDAWSVKDYSALLASRRKSKWPTMEVFLFAAKPSPALKATLNSIQAQLLPVRTHVISGPTMLKVALANCTSAYVAVLQAGEVVRPQALALAADCIVAASFPPVICADEDQILEDGQRCLPLFKPQPNHMLMCSGTLSTGLWLFALSTLPNKTDCGIVLDHACWAESFRLSVWLGLRRVNPARDTLRIAHVLTHRRQDTEAAPPEELAAVINAHFRQAQLPMHVDPVHTTPGAPLRLCMAVVSADHPMISIVVPSTCRSLQILRCLLEVLRVTSVRRFELILVISQPGPLDRRQMAFLRAAERDSRVRRVLHTSTTFNFAEACNVGVADAKGDLICLLNDDVSPLTSDWLGIMVQHLADPLVGVVGAKLLYPERTVQHGGVLMGLAGLCDHANRYLPEDSPGYAYRGILDQEVSAVTGACMLIRRSIFLSLGGLDEVYASAFNDIDFCLRVREAGYSVVFAAGAKLLHYETLSYGTHYSGDRAPAQAIDARRMRSRWLAKYAADPFHNRNLSLQRGNEWALAFPPRVTKFGCEDAVFRV